MTVKLLTLATLAYLSLAARYQPEFNLQPKPLTPQQIADEAIRASAKNHLATLGANLPAHEADAFLRDCEQTARELAHGELIEEFLHDVIRQRMTERTSDCEYWKYLCRL